MTTLVLFEHFQTLIADNFGIFIKLLDVNFGQFWYFSTFSGVNCGQLCIFNTLSDESESAVHIFPLFLYESDTPGLLIRS